VTSSFYAGPTRGVLNVGSWADLVTAVQVGSTTETQWVECKAAIPAAADQPNLELARDLASLTVDGGVLVIGVRDKATAAAGVVGTTDDIDQLIDRISQIAAGPRVQPPMHVVFGEPLQNPDDPTRHALLVSVPKSESAPHMVDSRYWGRSGNGKRELSNSEVEALIARRLRAQSRFEDHLRKMLMELDPIPTAERGLAHFCVSLQPRIPAPESYADLMGNRTAVASVMVRALQLGFQVVPSLFDLGDVVPHPDGLMLELRVNPVGEDATELRRRYQELQVMRLLVGADGSVTVFSTRGSFPREQDAVGVIDLGFIVRTVYQAVALAGHLGLGPLVYSGVWSTGICVNGLSTQLVPSSWGFGRHDASRFYARDEYTAVSSLEQECLVPRNSNHPSSRGTFFTWTPLHRP
jgi:hypothetical protein